MSKKRTLMKTPDPLIVWSDTQGQGRNIFVLFRRSFKLGKAPVKALFYVFADTRYRLRVNGHVAAYGPARFTPKAPQYDSIDLAPYLLSGANVITVEVNHKGASSFEALPSLGGFVAWGTIKSGKSASVDLSTPGAWKARRLDSHDAGAPAFSFAQGPVEIADLRKLPPAWFEAAFDDCTWPDAVPLERQDAWGTFTPRSIPMLTLEERRPERTLLVAELSDAEFRIGCRIDGPLEGYGAKKPRACYATFLYSPQAQDATLGLFWGPHYLNGERLERAKNERLGNREDYPVRLRQGWNLLYGEPELLAEGWGILIGIPHGRGIAAAAEPREGCDASLRHTGPVAVADLERLRAAIPVQLDDLPEVSGGWVRVPHGIRPPAPGREVGWDMPGEPRQHDVFKLGGVDLSAHTPNGGVAVFDFGGEFLGHVCLDIEAPAGTVVDICNEERVRADGLLDIYRTHWWIGSADRFVLRGGRERIEGFHPRGGRYLQVCARGANGPVTLHTVSVRQTLYPLQRAGRFECADPVFNWTWRAGIETLQACMEDAYLDCPWRERGAYVGDSLVEYHVQRAVSADSAMIRRCLWLWAKAQLDGGQLQDVVPAWKLTPLHDYTLIWASILRDYWALTGDRDLVHEVWPALERIFSSPDWQEAPSGLLDATGLHVFCDWGATRETKQGESAPLNAFRHAAYRATADLAKALGWNREAVAYRKAANRMRRAFQSLWLDDPGHFAATRLNGALVENGALHANILALFHGLANRRQAPRALAYIERELEKNLLLQPGHVELYFFYFLLNVLYDHGRAGLAERLIRSHYGLQRGKGAWTIWEGLGHNASLCHAWSCAPLHIFSERTLGVRQCVPGQPDRIVIAPHAGELAWAQGVVPHRRGNIEVSWRVHGGTLWLDAEVPRGVKYMVEPAGSLAGLPRRIKVRVRK